MFGMFPSNSGIWVAYTPEPRGGHLRLSRQQIRDTLRMTRTSTFGSRESQMTATRRPRPLSQQGHSAAARGPPQGGAGSPHAWGGEVALPRVTETSLAKGCQAPADDTARQATGEQTQSSHWSLC